MQFIDCYISQFPSCERERKKERKKERHKKKSTTYSFRLKKVETSYSGTLCSWNHLLSSCSSSSSAFPLLLFHFFPVHLIFQFFRYNLIRILLYAYWIKDTHLSNTHTHTQIFSYSYYTTNWSYLFSDWIYYLISSSRVSLVVTWPVLKRWCSFVLLFLFPFWLLFRSSK